MTSLPSIRRVLPLWLATLVSSGVFAQWAYPPVFEGTRTEIYKTVGETNLTLCIFEPVTAGTNRAAIVFFFGGGWQSGSPAQFEQQCRHFAARGMVAITADYRVGSRHHARAADCVADAKSCVRWIRKNAMRLGIDPQRIVAAGGSAGGHIAACTSTVSGLDEPGEDTTVSAIPGALVLFNPALVLAPMEGLDLKGFGVNLTKERLGAEARDLSPAHHIKPGTPPTLILHGKADTTVPFGTVQAFAAAMQRAGNRCELIGYEGQAHGFFNYGRGDGRYARETLAAADAFLVSLGYLASEADRAPAASGASAAKAAARPMNILHIHADDHRPDGLHALGNPVLQTPNLDRLVESGFTFTHCYTMGSMVGAVCQPSRTMLLTGRSWLRIPKPNGGEAVLTLPKVLSAAGYATFHVGKGGNEYTVGLNAFDTNLVMNDPTPDLRRGSSERHSDATIKFLTDRAKGRPFYVYFAPPVPHDPRVAAPEFHKFYDPAKVPLLAAFMPLHPFDNGEMTVRDEKLAPWPRTPADTRQQIADYYACVTGLDYHVGRIFAALKASGEWTNTIVIFTGDNGLSLGEHGLFGKQNLYEFGGMHVPCVIAGPRIPKGRSDALIYLMDLYPTFCDFGGAKAAPGVEGRSLVPILQGKAAKVRDVLYTGYRNCQRAVRDDRWKLIRYPLVDQTQLFDLADDPHELKNLAGDPQHATKVAEMTAWLEQEMKLHDDNAPLKVTNPKPPAWTPPANAGRDLKAKQTE